MNSGLAFTWAWRLFVNYSCWMLHLLSSLIHSTTGAFNHASVTNKIVSFPGCAMREQFNLSKDRRSTISRDHRPLLAPQVFLSMLPLAPHLAIFAIFCATEKNDVI